MNAFTALRRPSIACRLKAPRIHKQVGRNPPPTGFYVESGKQAEASRVKHQKLLKGGI